MKNAATPSGEREGPPHAPQAGLLATFALTVTSLAYVDPTAGGTLIQFLFGGFLAAMLMCGRKVWSRIVGRRGARERSRGSGDGLE